MRPTSDVHAVFRLAAEGRPKADIARLTGVSRAQVRFWLEAGLGATLSSPMRVAGRPHSPEGCTYLDGIDESAYAYLLGQYLGDGCISKFGRTWKLRITACDDYPGIMDEIEAALAAVLPNRVGRVRRQGCTEIGSFSNHWLCLFPQHGPGPKHERRIQLEAWQHDLAIQRHPAELIRGLIHSDGCRVLNRVRGANGDRYTYWRYFFTNESADIRRIFETACDQLGVEHRPNRRTDVSVARRQSVEILDQIVGPKY